MPLYEYYCSDCATLFELFRPMSQADQPPACEKCGSVHTAKVLSRFATIGNGGSTSTGASSSGCGGCSGGHCSTCAGR